MTVNLSSRYASGHYTRQFPNPRRYRKDRDNQGGYLGDTRESIPVLLRTTKSISSVSTVYIWGEGDRWDRVAQQFGIPRSDWWQIMDANPQIEFLLSLRPGDPINIPDSVRRRTL